MGLSQWTGGGVDKYLLPKGRGCGSVECITVVVW